MTYEGRLYQGLRGEDGAQYIAVFKLPPDAAADEMRRLQALVMEHTSEFEAMRTTAEMRAWWAAQHLPQRWELDFIRWRGHETP